MGTMSNVAIKVEDLSKQYRIGEKHRWGRTLRETAADALAPFRRRSAQRQAQTAKAAPTAEAIWALDGVSLQVERGEILGVIGRNGAGKSTLLKILSRITEPTRGFAEIHGRVGSLLEVGTGFHPQLTGRENVYLNGAILGMPRAEIEAKFDEIVAFADVEKFLDTPVRHYSSGMHVRLAFAVAAHVEPEILLIDEVLAVGDFAFQKKCLGKMQDVAGHGRTILFVSHSMGSVKALCTRCLLIENGKIVADGPPGEVVARYIDQHETARAEKRSKRIAADYGEGFFLHRSDELGDITILCGDPITLEFDIEAPKPLQEDEVGIGIQIVGKTGDPIVGMGTLAKEAPSVAESSRLWRVRCEMGNVPMYDGTYFVSVYVGNARHNRRNARFVHAFAIHVMPYDVVQWGNIMPRTPTYWVPEWDIQPIR
jgi:lipopolysaccharide transport system ATP-binding protein